ncbi:MAG: glycosyltransferase, partial [Solirubrobacterales bacterium]|nr:glycosyltransferase [Solirubrobacterales bacterium]
MTPRTTSRVDLHVHSTASQLSKLGVQRALGLPECATPPEEVYALAKRRGMDFVTITDHDTIDGALELTDRYDDAFVSVELTCAFRAEPQHVHVLCWGIDPDQFARLRERSGDVEAVAEELGEQDIACALAHPFYAVEAPLLPRHRRRLARLFPVWETRNGSRARELNAPAAVYIETHGGTGVAGSDDHAGVDIGRTYTETPLASDWRSFLDWVRDGQATARGDQGSAAKWAHSAMALAARVYGGAGDGSDTAPEPAAVLSMVERVMREGDARSGAIGADLGPDDARALLRAWLSAVELDLDERELLDMFQDESFHHAALFRRARRCHERKLSGAVDAALAAATQGGAALPGAPMPEAAPRLAQAPMPEAAPRLAQAASALFDACVAAIPYAPAAAFLGREKAKLVTRDGEPVRVALVADAVGGMHGVTHTLDELRERGVPGFDVEVVGTDHNVDRRLSAVAEVDIPFYSGLKVGVPSLPAVVEALAEGRYDLVHLCSPGPAGVAAGLVARIMDLPVIGSYHTELAVYTGLRTADPMMEAAARAAIAAFYGQCATVLSPSPSSDAVLESMGIASERVGRWDRGVDVGRFSPALHDPAWLPACASRGAASGIGSEVSVLYVGRLTREKGADLLADAFLAARERDPRLHLVLAGGGPEEEALRERLGEHATFLGWLEGDALARAYASADLFLFASRTDTFGQVLLEAQASGTPVIAVAEGGPTSIVEDGVTGRLCP